MSGRAWRIAALVVAPVGSAALVVMSNASSAIATGASILATAWLVMMALVIARWLHAARRDDIDNTARAGAVIDVLTASGAMTLWLAALAILGAVLTGWASFAVVAALGFGAVFAAVSWTVIAAAGDAPWQRATIDRKVVPALSYEGEPLREELRLTGAWIPPGMRLFAHGRAQPGGPIARYAIDTNDDVKLTAELGPAQRGDHRAPPLAMWLGDKLGLARTPAVLRGEAAFVVLPRPRTVIGAQRLLGPGGNDAIAQPATQATEGSFRLREYVDGDDARRIHWLRSQQIGKLISRLPDELPPLDPALRLVLDTHLEGIEGLTCHGPRQLLDALVGVWLGVAQSLVAAGVRVTLVSAARQGERVVAIERPMLPRMPREALRLGASVAWQSELGLGALLASSKTAPNTKSVRSLVVSARPRKLRDLAPSWLIVPEIAFAQGEPWRAMSSPTTLAFPTGAADNRASQRDRARRRAERMRDDRAMFSQVVCWSDWQTFSGHFVARVDGGANAHANARVALGVIP